MDVKIKITIKWFNIFTKYFLVLGTDWAIITLAMTGKFFISASFTMAWIYSAEVYPTCIRNLGVTVTGIAARISSAISPYIALLVDTYTNQYTSLG